MTTTQQREHEQEQDRVRGDQQRHQAAIRGQVIRTLGTPGDLQLVQVRQLWDDHYRVNVLIGENVASTRVAHSYFLVADGDGKILTSTPAITKRY